MFASSEISSCKITEFALLNFNLEMESFINSVKISATGYRITLIQYNGTATIFANIRGLFDAHTFGTNSPKRIINIVSKIISIVSMIFLGKEVSVAMSKAIETAIIEAPTFTIVLPIKTVTNNLLGCSRRVCRYR